MALLRDLASSAFPIFNNEESAEDAERFCPAILKRQKKGPKNRRKSDAAATQLFSVDSDNTDDTDQFLPLGVSRIISEIRGLGVSAANCGTLENLPRACRNRLPRSFRPPQDRNGVVMISFFRKKQKNDSEICGTLLTCRACFKYLACNSALSPHKHNLKSHPFRHGPHAHGSMIMIP